MDDYDAYDADDDGDDDVVGWYIWPDDDACCGKRESRFGRFPRFVQLQRFNVF